MNERGGSTISVNGWGCRGGKYDARIVSGSGMRKLGRD